MPRGIVPRDHSVEAVFDVIEFAALTVTFVKALHSAVTSESLLESFVLCWLGNKLIEGLGKQQKERAGIFHFFHRENERAAVNPVINLRP